MNLLILSRNIMPIIFAPSCSISTTKLPMEIVSAGNGSGARYRARTAATSAGWRAARCGGSEAARTRAWTGSTHAHLRVSRLHRSVQLRKTTRNSDGVRQARVGSGPTILRRLVHLPRVEFEEVHRQQLDAHSRRRCWPEPDMFLGRCG